MTSPNGGLITIEEGPVGSVPPGGFLFFGQQVAISAPDATPDNPLIIVFEIDASLVNGLALVAKNGNLVPKCNVLPPNAIDPDPCFSSIVKQSDGDLVITVFTSTASDWNFALPLVECRPSPAPTCLEGFEKGQLLVKENVPGKEKLIAKFLNGDALGQSGFGDPLEPGGTAYRLCIYDDADDLVGELEVNRAGDPTCSGGLADCWKPLGAAPPDGKGYKYKDKDLSAEGVAKMILKGQGVDGKTKALIKGKGAGLPGDIPRLLQNTGSVTMQLVSSNAGCLSMVLTDIKKQEQEFFKAKQ